MNLIESIFFVQQAVGDLIQTTGIEYDFFSFAELLLAERIFRDLLISVLSTFGVYLLSSLIYFEPWHMLTSSVQYMLLVPSFVNILMVYACIINLI
jgi:cellulose synthase/poly-beta-1,6-N-acetylglucosamine synthase-like glycosyltransferase